VCEFLSVYVCVYQCVCVYLCGLCVRLLVCEKEGGGEGGREGEIDRLQASVSACKVCMCVRMYVCGCVSFICMYDVIYL